jgi:hypothetical protein
MREEFGREKAESEEDYYRIWSRLPRETRDYVPLMIAAARISKEPEAYGFPLAAEFGTTVEEIRRLNPQFLIGRTPNDRDYPVRLPFGALAAAAQSASVNTAD